MNRSFPAYIALLTGSILLYSCGGNNKKMGMPSVAVNTYTVHPQEAVYHNDYPGNVVALSQVDLHAQVGGYITGIFFTEGDHVNKGQKLYEIDRSTYEAGYNQAQANVKVAEANLQQAKQDADRYKYLDKHDAIAKQTLDHSLTAMQNAESQVKAAKADLVKAQTDLKYSIITAPFSGTIGLSQVKLGALVVPGQTLLNTISTDDPMAADFVIDEKELPHYLALQKIKDPTADSLFTILLPDNSLYPHPGKIAVIDRGVDPQTGTIKVRLVFPNPTNDLRAGMSCTVRVRNEDTVKQLLVPQQSVIETMGEYFVYVLKDTTMKTNGKEPAKQMQVAVQKKVSVGQTIGDNIIVTDGLSNGEQVVTDGVQKLHDGTPVTTGGNNAGKH